jgi:hypothetical protein
VSSEPVGRSSRLLLRPRDYIAASSVTSKCLTTRARHSEATALCSSVSRIFGNNNTFRIPADERELVPTASEGTLHDGDSLPDLFLRKFTFKYARERLFKAFHLVSL